MNVALAHNNRAAIQHYINPASIEGLTGLDRVAEILSQGGDTVAVANICGYANRQVANSQLQVIRRRLGWQAQ